MREDEVFAPTTNQHPMTVRDLVSWVHGFGPWVWYRLDLVADVDAA